MKINRIAWQNYRGLDDGEINPNGNDVTVTGRNGVGKSSIAGIVPFVLFGEKAATSKRIADGLIPTDDGLIHAAEIEFDDGTTLRREYAWDKTGNRHRLLIDGKDVPKKVFDARVFDLTKGGGELVLNPFAFCNLTWSEQRDLLLQFFGGDISIEPPDILGDTPPAKFITDIKADIKSRTADAEKIPPAIEEIHRQLKEIGTGDIDELKTARDAAFYERDKIRDMDEPKNVAQLRVQLGDAQSRLGKLCAPNAELNFAQNRRCELQSLIDQHQRDLQEALDDKARLQNDYRRTKHHSTCPTCKQPLPADMVNQQLKEIAQRGFRANDKIKRLQDVIAADQREFDRVNAQVNRLKNPDQDEIAKLNATVADLQNNLNAAVAQDKHQRGELIALQDKKISDANKRIDELQRAQSLRERVNQLAADERSLAQEISELKLQLDAVKNFLADQISVTEDAINKNFQHVKFKLFDFAITTGEAKPTCEATLHGVPYSSLSKGERLKAALDIFIALQNHFGVQLPLIIDDAESYTPNSFIDLPNQKFFFSVCDGDLHISEGSVPND